MIKKMIMGSNDFDSIDFQDKINDTDFNMPIIVHILYKAILCLEDLPCHEKIFDKLALGAFGQAAMSLSEEERQENSRTILLDIFLMALEPENKQRFIEAYKNAIKGKEIA